MITVGIIDDEQIFCDKIKNILLLEFDCLRTFTYNSINELDQDFDFMILNIDMPDYDGIDYAKANEDKKIIFVTSHNHRYKEAFGPNVYGFVSKNNVEDELVERDENRLARIKNQHRIDLKIDGEILEIKTDSIIYCMYLGDMNIAVIFDDRQAIIKNKTLKSLLKVLGKDFICINRSVIINKKKILKIFNNQLCLKGVNCLFEISRRKKSLVLKAFYEKNF